MSPALAGGFFFFFFKLYIIVLVLPNIKMNLPQVYKEGSYFNLKGEELQDVRVERYCRENLIQTISEMGKLRLREVKMK